MQYCLECVSTVLTMARRAGLRPAEILALLQETDYCESDGGELSDNSDSDFELPLNSSESSGDESSNHSEENVQNTLESK